MITEPSSPQARPRAVRSLLGLAGESPDRLRAILREAKSLRPVALGRAQPSDTLRGRSVVTMFFEPSTRTRTSFTIAAQRMGAGVSDLSIAASSVGKGESMVDTARNVEAMGADALIVRASRAGAAHIVGRAVECAVINAGDGRHEHPTQGLLDLAAFAEAMGRDEDFDLSGLRLAIVGDVISSRVARSAAIGFTALGASVTLVGSAQMAPAGLTAIAEGVVVEHDLEAILPEMDGVMMLRIQFERFAAAPSLVPGAAPNKVSPIASVRAYREQCALTVERAARMKPGAVVMHPGPINRGVELDGPVADGHAGPRSLVMSQVSWGVAVRAAVLADCLR